MATGTVVFQTTVATPPSGLAVMADAVNDSDHGAGTTQYVKIMDGATAGTAKASVTTTNGLAVDVTRVQGTIQALGTVQTHGTSQALGTFQGHGTFQALGTFQPLAGSVHLAAGSVNAQGVIAHDAAIGGNPILIGAFGTSGTQTAVADGDLVRLWADLNGRLQVRGTIDAFGGTVLGTVQVHGTAQVLGSVQPVGTAQVLGTVQTHGTSQVLGSVQTVGTSQALGTFQPLAGSVHLAAGSVNAQGVIAHDAVIAGNPVLIGAFGTSGTQTAVADGDLVRLWADLNGRLQVRGTIDSIGTIQVLGSVQSHGTNQALGTFQSHGTNQALGTMQPLAGSVHLASNLPGGSINAQGVVAHDAVVGGNPILVGAFGTSGTQTAVADGDLVRLWADLNGRLQVGDGAGSITVDSAQLPAALGQTTMANSLPVVLPSNQSAIPINNNNLEVTGTAAALNADAIASTDVSSYRWAAVQVTGTWSGTLTFQGSNDNSTFVSVGLNSSASVASVVGSITTANGLFFGPVNYRFFRVRMTSYSSGTATVTVELSSVPSALHSLGVTVIGQTASATTDSGNPVKTGSKVNTTAPAFTDGQRADTQGDTTGSTYTNGEGRKATYSAAIIGLAPAASATDVAAITGSASKTIRVTKIEISGLATAAGAYDIVLAKRSTANSGGTSTNEVEVPHDSANAAASATVLSYTANPTTGTLVGNVNAKKITVTTAAGAIPNVPTVFDFTMRSEQAIVLRGTGQVLALNLNGVTMTGGSLDITITWTEE